MIFSLEQRAGQTLAYDVCIVGGGAAGITLATRLSDRGHRVLLAEAGDLQFTDNSQRNYKGKVIGDEYFELEHSRLRFFGGSTNHWNGMCRPLDAHDFQAKNGDPNTAWPLTRAELDPYLKEAAKILELGDIAEDTPLEEHSELNEVEFTNSTPVRFGQKYQQHFQQGSQLDLCVNANLVEVDYRNGEVAALGFVNYRRDKLRVSAKRFVLACGGIENSRLLLHFNRIHDNQLGNRHDLVGRYWFEHPHVRVGDFVLTNDKFLRWDKDQKFYKSRRYLSPSQAFIQQQQILNCGLRLSPQPSRQGAKQVILDLLCETPVVGRNLLSMYDNNISCVGELHAAWEQQPRASNRIMLGVDKDDLGIPRTELYWRKSPLDKKTIQTCAMSLARFFATRDYGRIKLHNWVLSEDNDYPAGGQIAGKHHMGGTRMAGDERHGVTDANCRIFNTSNFYVAGSSLFPSGGHANPTLTIVQLALRLADHLHGQLAGTA